MNPMENIGINLRHYYPGTQRVPCPECDRGSRDTALAVTIEDDDCAVWLCHRCGFKGSTRHRVERATRPQKPPIDAVRHESLSARGRELWRECEPLRAGSLAARYLAYRSCVLPPSDSDLRQLAKCWHWPSQQHLPALVGLITDFVTCESLSLHFTFLKPDGTAKADVERQKLLLPKHKKAGGVIRIWPDEAVTYAIGLAEGIETALSLAHAYSPCWATVDSSNLASLPVLNGIETVLVAVDNDDAGAKAYEQFARRWVAAGVDVLKVISDTRGYDLNDEARAA